jgi:signal transduction histidine kinase
MSFIQNKQINTLRKQRNLLQQAELEKQVNQAKKAELEKEVDIRTAELKQQNEKLTAALAELSATQQQLVHAEKMASLGELTAGIAHEIQNPLNFINNFAELNAELAAELKTALEQGDTQDAIDLANDMAENSLKIAHHGKRADSIVKSMLQHSRGTTGQKEWINLNNLADECLRLSFHGMKAKDKQFHASYRLQLQEDLPLTEAFPQDLGRVLLNLINNAFYAVSAKNEQGGGEGYVPTVTVSTTLADNAIHIGIEDNGNGIPQQIRDKIFQPFFTTKPTGQGTGLGLSLSYDIIKAHQGELRLETEEGHYSKFTIVIPLIKKSS